MAVRKGTAKTTGTKATKKVTTKKVSQKAPVKKPAAKKVKVITKPELQDFLGEIEKRAYELFQERSRNGIPGGDMTDWLNAENEVKAKYKI